MRTTSLIKQLNGIAFLSLILLISYQSYGQTLNKWWSNIPREYGVDRKDFRVINNIVVLSDSISDTKSQTYFDKPSYITKEKDNLYIFSCDSIILNKNDSIITLFNGLEIGFSLLNNENKPILITEFDKVINDIKKYMIVIVQKDYDFSWIDRDYLSKIKSQVETETIENK